MSAALVVGRVVLAGVFSVAGVAKLADLSGSRQALAGFGLPERLAGPAGLVLPVFELVVAVCLLVSALAWWGAVGAFALLVAFCGGIVVAMARGLQPDCHCFGQVHSARVGLGTLARNVLLAGMAGFVLVGGWRHAGLSATHWVTTVSAAVVVAVAAGLVVAGLVGFVAWFCLQLLRQNGRILQRLDAMEARLGSEQSLPASTLAASNGQAGVARPGLGVGERAPAFSLPDLTGEPVRLERLVAAGLPVLLVFSDPHCGPCTALLPELASWEAQHERRLTIALLSRRSDEENRLKMGELGLRHVLMQTEDEVAQAYQCYGTPGAVLVSAAGTIASPLAHGAEQIRALVEGSVDPLALIRVEAGGNGNGRSAPEPAPQALRGERAPEITLLDLDGNSVGLADRLGQPVVLLFWNPHCGFCERMLDDLKAFEVDPPEGAPELVVISTGTVEENRAQGLRSTVLLDHEFSTSATFGAGGTPMAVLIDAQGNVASPVAAGAEQVLTLASTPTSRASNGASPRRPRARSRL